MSDDRLREIERRWKETGAVEDEAAWLLERLRVGAITGIDLELAAILGHHASARALADRPMSAQARLLIERATGADWRTRSAARSHAWQLTLERLDARGSECHARVYTALARLALEKCQGLQPDSVAERALQDVERALVSPSSERARILDRGERLAADADSRRSEVTSRWDDPYGAALFMILCAARVLRGGEVSFAETCHELEYAVDGMGVTLVHARSALRSALVPWLLKTGATGAGP